MIKDGNLYTDINGHYNLAISIECDLCGSISKQVQLGSRVYKDTFFHCNRCDTYYKIAFENESDSTYNRVRISLKEVGRREVMDGILTNYDFRLIELEEKGEIEN